MCFHLLNPHGDISLVGRLAFSNSRAGSTARSCAWQQSGHEDGSQQRQQNVRNSVGYGVANHRNRVAGDGFGRVDRRRAGMLTGDGAAEDGRFDMQQIAADIERSQWRQERKEYGRDRQLPATLLEQRQNARCGRRAQ